MVRPLPLTVSPCSFKDSKGVPLIIFVFYSSGESLAELMSPLEATLVVQETQSLFLTPKRRTMPPFPSVEYHEVDVRCLLVDKDRKSGLIQAPIPFPSSYERQRAVAVDGPP